MTFFRTLCAASALLCTLGAHAQEAEIRKVLSERIPQLQQIDSVTATPMQGLYEVRVGTDIFYSDSTGHFLIQGELIDTQARRNLTEDRIHQLTAVDFKSLPLKDAIKVVRGNGKRHLAVFADPNCGYCKRFERDLLNLNNVTVHTFLYPILSPDSAEKSRDIWCAKDRQAAWNNWMLSNQLPEVASCDTSALQRNLALGKKHKITGTPTVLLQDGTRIPGAVSAKELDKRLAAIQ